MARVRRHAAVLLVLALAFMGCRQPAVPDTTDAPAPSVSDDGPPPPSDDAWAMAGRDAARSHASTQPVRPPLRELWRTPITGASVCIPCLADRDHVYAIAADKPGAAEGRMSLISLDVETGRIEWRTVLPGAHYAIPYPVLAGERIWVLDELGMRDQLVCVDAAGGKAHALQPPAPLEEIGLLGSLRMSNYQPLAVDGALIALMAERAYSLSDGRPLWSGAGDRIWTEGIDAAIAVQGGFVGGGLSNAGGLAIVVCDPTTGELSRETPLTDYDWPMDGDVRGACATPDGDIAVLTVLRDSSDAASAQTLAVEAAGDIRWRLDGYVSLGVLGGDRVFCQQAPEPPVRQAGLPHQGRIAAVSLETGRPLWYAEVAHVSGTPVVADSVLWLLSDAGDGNNTGWSCSLVALWVADGSRLWSVDGAFFPETIAAHGRLFGTVAGPDGSRQGPAIVALAHGPDAPEQ